MQDIRTKVIGRVHSIESCGTVDGPGIRTVVFMQGCALRCQYCHNPDTWDINRGNEYTPEQLIDEILKYKSFMRFSGGGVTFTGGEPLLQSEFILEVSKLCKENDISIAIDTSGFIWNDTVKDVLDYTDIVLLDIKNFDPAVYQTLTGGSITPTLQMLEYLKERKIITWVRYVVVPNLTDNLESIKQLADYMKDYPNISKIELLPFHKMGEFKWKELGLEYKLAKTQEPGKELMQTVKTIFEGTGKLVVLNS